MFKNIGTTVTIISLCLIGNLVVDTKAEQITIASDAVTQTFPGPSNVCGYQEPVVNGTLYSKSADGSKECETVYENSKIIFTQVHNLDSTGKKLTSDKNWYNNNGVKTQYEYVVWNSIGLECIKSDTYYYDTSGNTTRLFIREFTETGSKLVKSTDKYYTNNVITKDIIKEYNNSILLSEMENYYEKGI